MSLRRALVLVASFCLALGIYVPIGLAGTESAVRSSLVISGRASFFLFLVPFVASSLVRLWPRPSTRWLMKYRGEFGLIFAGAHAAHLCLILWLASIPGTAFAATVIAVGGFGLVLVAALALTSFPGPTRALGPRRWKRLHRVGVHYLAGIFAFDWLSRLGRDPWVYGPLAGLLAAAYVLRFAAKKRG